MVGNEVKPNLSARPAVRALAWWDTTTYCCALTLVFIYINHTNFDVVVLQVLGRFDQLGKYLAIEARSNVAYNGY